MTQPGNKNIAACEIIYLGLKSYTKGSKYQFYCTFD